MRASEMITRLQQLMKVAGDDPIVVIEISRGIDGPDTFEIAAAELQNVIQLDECQFKTLIGQANDQHVIKVH